MPKTPIAMQNLGAVTSYAEAVAGGYKGTREEYREDMAKLASNVTQVRTDRAAVEEAKKNTVEAKDTAISAAKSAEEYAAEAAKSVADGAYVSMEIGNDGCLYRTKTDNLNDIDFVLIGDELYLEVYE